MPSNEIMSMEGQLVGMPLAGPETFSQQQLDYLKRALGVDETVLYEGDLSNKQAQTSVALNEAASNFKRLRFIFADRFTNIVGETSVDTEVLTYNGSNTDRVFMWGVFLYNTTNPLLSRASQFKFSNSTTLTLEGTAEFKSTANGAASSYSTQTGNGSCYIYKVIGIGRIAGGN